VPTLVLWGERDTALLTGCLRSTQSQVLSELNADRSAHRIRTLGTQADAQRKAQAWAEKLARENKLYHSTLSAGIGVKWCSLGENVGYAGVPAIEDATWPRPATRPTS
jgi:hypothetical protein